MVYNLKQLHLMPDARFFKSDHGAQKFEVSFDRYYQGHDLAQAFCYLKVTFSDGSDDKFLLTLDSDENTVTVSAYVTADMQRVEGMARYQLSFESASFIVQSSVFEAVVSSSLGDALSENPDVPAVINELQELIQTDIDELTDRVDALEVLVKETTYAALVAKKSAGTLVEGEFYRITDYNCVIDSDVAVSADHPFDIIVKATGANTLSETAFAAEHAGNNYFSGGNVAAWQLRYCIDNDVSRFDWADDQTGKGVIYYMKDEWGNECPYDFKNIKFKRVYYGSTYYAYTFSIMDVNSVAQVIAGTGHIYDSTVVNASLINHKIAHTNVIKPFVDDSDFRCLLNDIVIIGQSGYGCYGNKFGANCYEVTAGRDFYDNVFEGDCRDLSFGNECDHNYFGEGCEDSSFGNDFAFNSLGICCASNAFGDNCEANTLGAYCHNNTFGKDCSYNTLGNYCYTNVFGNGFANNTLGNQCVADTFGKECQSNSIGNYFVNNRLGNNCSFNSVGNDCMNNQWGNIDPSYYGDNFMNNTVMNAVRYTVCSANEDVVGYLTIADGVCGENNNNKLDIYCDELEGNDYSHHIETTADGKIVIRWTSEIGIEEYLYKNTSSDPAWTAATVDSNFAEIAENLTPYSDNSGVVNDTPFIFQTAGGSSYVGGNVARLKELRGYTLVFNQLIDEETTEVVTTAGHKYLSRISSVERIFTSVGETVTVDNAVADSLYDLTLMFGFGNEPTTVAQFRAVFPYENYEYTAGEIISSKSSALKSVGFNAYDPTTGTAKLIGGKEYQLTGTYTSFSYYNIIGVPETITLDGEGKFTPLLSGEMTIVGGNSTDTCVHLVWGGERDGEFEPYEAHIYELPDVELQSVGDIYDSITSDGVLTRRVNNSLIALVDTPQFNQIFDPAYFPTETFSDGFTITNNGDGSFTLNGTTTGSRYQIIGGPDNKLLITGHKYLINQSYSDDITHGMSGWFFGIRRSAGYALFEPTIFTADAEDYGFAWRVVSGTTLDNVTVKMYCIDLTEMFGAGNEPSTVQEFRALFPNEFYEYKSATVNADGATKYNYRTTDYEYYLYNKAVPTVEQITGFTEAQYINDFGTQEFLSDQPIQAPQGNKYVYIVDYKAFIDSLGQKSGYSVDNIVTADELEEALAPIIGNVVNLPTAAGSYVLKVTIVDGILVYQWILR